MNHEYRPDWTRPIKNQQIEKDGRTNMTNRRKMRGSDPFFASATLAKMMRKREASQHHCEKAREAIDGWLRPGLEHKGNDLWAGPIMIMPKYVKDEAWDGSQQVVANATGVRRQRQEDGSMVISSAQIEVRAKKGETIEALRAKSTQIIATQERDQCNWRGETKTVNNDAPGAQSSRTILGWADPWCVPIGPAERIVHEAIEYAYKREETGPGLESLEMDIVAQMLASGWRGLWRRWLEQCFGKRTCTVHKLLLKHPRMKEGPYILKLAGGTTSERRRKLDWIKRYPMSAHYLLEDEGSERAVMEGRSEAAIWRRISLGRGENDRGRIDATEMQSILERQWPGRLPGEVRKSEWEIGSRLSGAYKSSRWFIPTNRIEWVKIDVANKIACRMKDETNAKTPNEKMRQRRTQAAMTILEEEQPRARNERQAQTAGQATYRKYEKAIETSRRGGRYWVDRTVDGNDEDTKLKAAEEWDETLWSGESSSKIAEVIRELALKGEEIDRTETKREENERQEEEQLKWVGPETAIAGLKRAKTLAEVRNLAKLCSHPLMVGRWKEGRMDVSLEQIPEDARIHIYANVEEETIRVLAFKGKKGRRKAWRTTREDTQWSERMVERWNACEVDSEDTESDEHQAYERYKRKTNGRKGRTEENAEEKAYRACETLINKAMRQRATNRDSMTKKGEGRYDPWETFEIPF